MSKEDKENKSDHDLIIRIDERVDKIGKWCFNHDAHHFRYNIMAWTATIGLVIALILALARE